MNALGSSATTASIALGDIPKGFSFSDSFATTVTTQLAFDLFERHAHIAVLELEDTRTKDPLDALHLPTTFHELLARMRLGPDSDSPAGDRLADLIPPRRSQALRAHRTAHPYHSGSSESRRQRLQPLGVVQARSPARTRSCRRLVSIVPSLLRLPCRSTSTPAGRRRPRAPVAQCRTHSMAR